MALYWEAFKFTFFPIKIGASFSAIIARFGFYLVFLHLQNQENLKIGLLQKVNPFKYILP
jgi:hypothetical protein